MNGPVTIGGKPGWVCGVCRVVVTQAHFKRHLRKHDREGEAKSTVDAAWRRFVDREAGHDGYHITSASEAWPVRVEEPAGEPSGLRAEIGTMLSSAPPQPGEPDDDPWPVPVGDETEALRREVDLQMGSKLEAQSVLKAITDSLCLTFSELGNGWMEAAPKILARIETIVDEAGRGFRERDGALACVARLEDALNAAKDLYERVEMDESVGICLSERTPSLRFGDAITAAEQALARVAGLEAREASLRELVDAARAVLDYEHTPRRAALSDLRAALDALADSGEAGS